MTTADKKRLYDVLETRGDYTLINRAKVNTWEPYVVCWLFDKDTYTWAQGHYFQDLERALFWMKEKTK